MPMKRANERQQKQEVGYLLIFRFLGSQFRSSRAKFDARFQRMQLGTTLENPGSFAMPSVKILLFPGKAG